MTVGERSSGLGRSFPLTSSGELKFVTVRVSDRNCEWSSVRLCGASLSGVMCSVSSHESWLNVRLRCRHCGSAWCWWHVVV